MCCNSTACEGWVGEERSPADGLQLPPIAEHENVHSTKWSRSASVRSPLEQAPLPDNFGNYEFKLSEQLRGDHANFDNEDEAQALAFR